MWMCQIFWSLSFWFLHYTNNIKSDISKIIIKHILSIGWFWNNTWHFTSFHIIITYESLNSFPNSNKVVQVTLIDLFRLSFSSLGSKQGLIVARGACAAGAPIASFWGRSVECVSPGSHWSLLWGYNNIIIL